MTPRAPRAVTPADAPASSAPVGEGDAASLNRSVVNHPGRVALAVALIAVVAVVAWRLPRLPDSVVVAALAVAVVVVFVRSGRRS